jgi:hypothetical protein
MAETSKSPYAVGYAKPPTNTRFKPGQSGNPGGRPKGAKNFGTAIEDALRGRVTVTENGKRRRLSMREVIAKRLVNRAAEGDLRAVPVLLNEARAHQNLSSGDGVNEIFAGSEDREVIDGIVQRIRRGSDPSPLPEPNPDPLSDPKADETEAPE